MEIRNTAKLHIDKKKGSAVIYLKKEFVEKIHIEKLTELMVVYNTDKKELIMTEL
jgi:hypothetical protein